MSTFEWAADYEALCSCYKFKVSTGPHGKELKATAPASRGQVLLVESPLIAWLVRASAPLDAFSCCENCLKIRPFIQPEGQHKQKVRVSMQSVSHAAASTSAARSGEGNSVISVQPCDLPADGARSQHIQEEEAGVCMHDKQGNEIWFCSLRCHQQAVGVAAAPVSCLDAAEAAITASEPEPLTPQKRDACGSLKDSNCYSPQSTACSTGGVSSEGRSRGLVFGWQEFLSFEALRSLRRHDRQHHTRNSDVPVEEDYENPIGLEALGRAVARVAATAASLHSLQGLGMEDAYAEACRPFLRFEAAQATEVRAAFDVASASVNLQALLGPSISAVLGEDVAAALLGVDALVFLYGTLMRNAQSLLIWGATHEGALMIVRAAGVYVLQACCNHSCVPNCFVENGTDACITLKAVMPIAQDEELTITYVPLGLAQSSRQELLSNYNFICDCPRCTREKGQLS